MKNELLITGVWMLLIMVTLLAGCTSSPDENFENNMETPSGESPQESAPQNAETNTENPSGTTIIPSEMRRGMDNSFTEACSGKNAGEACVLTMRNNTVNGTCVERNGTLSCQIANMPGPMNRSMQGPGGIGDPRRMNETQGNPPQRIPEDMPQEMPQE